MDKVKNIVIEEYANVDETFQNVKNIKAGSMTLNDLFGDNLKVIENALEERKKLLKWKESQQDLIKGKDEYIAKLCNDRAELKAELKELQEFAKIVATKGVAIGFIQLLEKENAGGVNEYNDYIGGDKNLYLTEAQFNFVKKVVERYGKEED